MPVNHEIFDELNAAQWLWYFHQFQKDQDERFTFERDFTEYLASFIEPQAVRKIVESREKAVEVDDVTFASTVAGVFGRSLPNAPKEIPREIHGVNMAEILNNIQALNKPKNDSIFNYRYWTEFNL